MQHTDVFPLYAYVTHVNDSYVYTLRLDPLRLQINRCFYC